jgi:hypothetical protein
MPSRRDNDAERTIRIDEIVRRERKAGARPAAAPHAATSGPKHLAANTRLRRARSSASRALKRR